MIEQVQALWRPLTGFVMSAVVLLVAFGLLPASAEAHANGLLTTAGGVLAALTAMRGVQRVAEVNADKVKAQAAAKVGELLPATLETVRPPPEVAELLDQVKALRAQLGAVQR